MAAAPPTGDDLPRPVELMTDYLEGALTGKERERFEQHLHHCPPCVRILDQLARHP